MSNNPIYDFLANEMLNSPFEKTVIRPEFSHDQLDQDERCFVSIAKSDNLVYEDFKCVSILVADGRTIASVDLNEDDVDKVIEALQRHRWANKEEA